MKKSETTRKDVFKTELTKMLRDETKKGTDVGALLRDLQRGFETVKSNAAQEALHELLASLGSKGGKARAKSLSPTRRRQIAKEAAAARERKRKGKG